MKTVQEELAKAHNVDDGFISRETRAREALDWAIDATPVRLPPHLQDPYGWHWDADDVSLYALTDFGEYRFHVAGERRGTRLIRIAVLSVTDAEGKVLWEHDIPHDWKPTNKAVK